MTNGIDFEEIVIGTGRVVERGCEVCIDWIGTLNRGDEFGNAQSTFRVGSREVIAGLELGVIGMKVGGVRNLRISPHLAYRDQSVPGVPANAVLNFRVKLLNVR